MIQEEKQLLLKELCVRAPHGVICQFIWTFSNETTNGEDVITKGDDIIRCIDICTEEIQANYYGEWVNLEHCKPYLRPMSSMTTKELEEYNELFNSSFDAWTYVDWMNKHHFDYRGLILMGLALEAPEDMYKTE